MPTEKKLRVFKIEESGIVKGYSIRDSHINLAYGVCSTEEATTAKVVTLVNDPGWELKVGSMISVKFLYPVPVASTLNVDNTGAKDIWQHGAAAVNVIRANDTVQLVYDGTRYSILAIDSASQLRAGEAGGLATLDASGKIPGSQLPSYVDDVLEFANRVDFPVTGESGKIYVDTSSNESYRWSGSTYIRIDDVDEFVGATENTSGSAGLVPAPASGDQHKFLGANGQWNDLDASIDIDISLPVDGWSATQPYTYTWLDSNVTDGCTVKVYFLTGSEEDDTLFIEFEKVAGGVQFTAPTLPTDPIPVRIHLIYFETGINVQEPTEADRISTDAIHGAANVEEALTTLNNKFNAKLDKPVNVPADRFLRTDADGQAVWAAAASSSEVADAVSDWLSDNITTGQTIALDESLTVEGAAGDAKATGDRLNAFADAETGIVAVSETQPQSADNRLWIKDDEVEEYSVPTYAEHEALSDEVSELKDALNELEESLFVLQEQTVTSTSNNFRLNESDGLSTQNYSYKLEKYNVTAGDTVKIISYDRFQFQTASSVPTSGTSNRVGDTYGSGTFILEVPATAEYVICSVLKTGGTKLYKITETPNERFNAIEESIDTLEGSIEDLSGEIEDISPTMIEGIDDYLENGTVPVADPPTFTISEGGIDKNGANDHYGSNSYKRTVEYLDVSEISALSITPSADVTIYVALYDSASVFIRRDVYTEAAIQDLSGAAYIRVAGYKNTELPDSTFIASFTLVGNPGMKFIESHIIKTKTEPVATWVDDDAIVLNNSGLGIEVSVRPILEELGICCTFAAITPLSGNVVVDDNTMTKVEYFQWMQGKGNHITSHPTHTAWAGTGYDIDKVNETLVQTIVYLQSNGFLHSDMLVYPGSSWNNPDVVDVVRKWCECGVKPGYGTPNFIGDTTKWQIKRTFVNFEDYYTNHHNDAGFVSSMAWYKAQVDAAFENNGWIIFGTHSYQFTDSDDTTDPNENTRGNLKELMQYALTKGLKFRTLWDEYNRRKNIYLLNE